MRVYMAGQYRTKSNHLAEVAAIKGQFALGWVEKKGKYKPTSWSVEDGTVWTGGYGDNLVDYWQEPAPGPMITGPGLYRDQSGRRVEIVDVRGQLAIGWRTGKTGNATVGAWYVATGRHHDENLPDRQIVGPWHEPVTKSIDIVLCESATGDHYVRCFYPEVKYRKIVARRTVTITEGEGMGTGERPDDQGAAK